MERAEIKRIFSTAEIDLPKEVLNQLMDGIGESNRLAKTKAESQVDELANKKAEKLATEKANDLLKEKTAELEKEWQAKLDAETKKYDDEKASHDATKLDYTNKEKTATINKQVGELLTSNQTDYGVVKADFVEYALNGFDASSVEFDEKGVIKNGDDILKSIHGTHGKLFGKVTVEGTPQIIPPNGDTKTLNKPRKLNQDRVIGK